MWILGLKGLKLHDAVTLLTTLLVFEIKVAAQIL